MLNVHDLERRWLRYKIKTYIPISVISISVLIGTILFLVFFPFSAIEVQESDLQKTIAIENQKVVEIKKEITIEVPQNTQKQIEKKTLILKPSLHFMDNIEEGLSPFYNEVITDRQDMQTPAYSQDTVRTVRTVRTEDTQEPIKKKSSLTITTKKDEVDLKDVIRRFKKNKNPSLSLFIAKRYYELAQYQKSYNYALMTNEINKDIDESWIIFSKSLVKLGQHELAIVTLKSYLKSNKSTQAEILLRKIESGNFR